MDLHYSDTTEPSPFSTSITDALPEKAGSVSACAATGDTGTAPGLAGAVTGSPGQAPSMANPVTRHASSPCATEFQSLLYGIDTLDLGLSVTWGGDWKRRLLTLDQKKKQARKKDGLLIPFPSGRSCVFKANGKGENYSFHLQFEAYNLFLSRSARAGSTPNVYLSISAKTLWLCGIDTAMSWIREDLGTIGGGRIQNVQVSRVDLCADFWIPNGLSHDFLLTHKITRNDKGKLFLDKNELQTYYVADSKSPIQLRIYNKGLEVKLGKIKLWFLDLWNKETLDDIWRVEFQLRRPALKEFGINTLQDLQEKKGGVWEYLTGQWFSLRYDDNDKAERRTLHPFWLAVQCSFAADATTEVKRAYGGTGTASPEWHLSHIDGCLSSFAALLGITDRNAALQELQLRLERRNNASDFTESCIKKAIQRGTLNDGGHQ